MSSGRRVVIGVGNEYRGDDGIGPAVVARLRALPLPPDVTLAVTDGEPTRMLDLWSGADLAVVVDAVRTGGDHGGHVYEVAVDDLEVASTVATGHRVGLGSTVELARVLRRLPARLVVFAVDGTDFGFGIRLTPAVAAAVEPVIRRVRDVLT
jgi:hydrogenase maturation protease